MISQLWLKAQVLRFKKISLQTPNNIDACARIRYRETCLPRKQPDVIRRHFDIKMTTDNVNLLPG